MGKVTSCLGALIWAVSMGTGEAHEFWIEPTAFLFENGETAAADVVVGERLVGTRFPFEPRGYAKAIWAGPDGATDLSRLALARGPLSLSQKGEGLHILAVESFPQRLTYDTPADFESFARSVGQADALRHVSVEGPVSETYRRLSKTLVHFGLAKGQDRRIGLAREWVSDGTSFQLFDGTEPVGDQAVFLFCRRDQQEPTAVALRTNGEGRVSPHPPSGATCLLNTVFLTFDRHWQSDWVSILFQIE